MNDLPEGTSVEIFPGAVGAGIGVNGESGQIVEVPDYKVLHEVVVAGKVYERRQYDDGHSRLVKKA